MEKRLDLFPIGEIFGRGFQDRDVRVNLCFEQRNVLVQGCVARGVPPPTCGQQPGGRGAGENVLTDRFFPLYLLARVSKIDQAVGGVWELQGAKYGSEPADGLCCCGYRDVRPFGHGKRIEHLHRHIGRLAQRLGKRSQGVFRPDDQLIDFQARALRDGRHESPLDFAREDLDRLGVLWICRSVKTSHENRFASLGDDHIGLIVEQIDKQGR